VTLPWKNSWFQLSAFAALVSAVLLLIDYGPRLASQGPARQSAPQAATASASPPAAGAPLAGDWALQGLGCGSPVVVSVNGQLLSVTTAGKTSIAKVTGEPRPGVVEALADDGAYEYALGSGGVLSVKGPGGLAMTLTRCGGRPSPS
jgi:hypothetical protein